MVDKFLHGPTRDHHKFTMASMISRRADRRLSDLVCGIGLTLPYSSGKVEGNLNRIKMLKGRCTVAPDSTC